MFLPFLPPLAKLIAVGLVIVLFSTIALGLWIESVEKARGINLSIPYYIVKLVGAVAVVVGFVGSLWMLADLDGFVLYFGG